MSVNSAKLKVFEAFAGYGSQAMALSRLRENYPQFDYEVVGISEIDKYALQAYQAVHGHCPNYGDISKIDWNTVPDFDLLTYSFPCTDSAMLGNKKVFQRQAVHAHHSCGSANELSKSSDRSICLWRMCRLCFRKSFCPTSKNGETSWASWAIHRSHRYSMPRNLAYHKTEKESLWCPFWAIVNTTFLHHSSSPSGSKMCLNLW